MPRPRRSQARQPVLRARASTTSIETHFEDSRPSQPGSGDGGIHQPASYARTRVRWHGTGAVGDGQAWTGLGPEAAAGGGPYRPGSGVEPPRLLREVKAQYTEDARTRGITGDVVLEIVIRSDGTVGDVKILRGLGFGLDERAVTAVRNWKFSPARRLGTAVDVIVEVEVEFSLR